MDEAPRIATADALLTAARLARNGDTAHAIAICDLVLLSDPCHVSAWRTRAHLQARLRLWSPAIESLSHLIGTPADVATDLLSRARWCLEVAQWPAAIADLSMLLVQGFDASARPWRGLASLLRGGASVKVGLYAGALRDLSRLPAQASVRVGMTRWHVAQLRLEAEMGLRSITRFPHAG